eukprot:2588757-Amphidinium_carterae.1
MHACYVVPTAALTLQSAQYVVNPELSRDQLMGPTIAYVPCSGTFNIERHPLQGSLHGKTSHGNFAGCSSTVPRFKRLLTSAVSVLTLAATKTQSASKATTRKERRARWRAKHTADITEEETGTALMDMFQAIKEKNSEDAVAGLYSIVEKRLRVAALQSLPEVMEVVAANGTLEEYCALLQLVLRLDCSFDAFRLGSLLSTLMSRIPLDAHMLRLTLNLALPRPANPNGTAKLALEISVANFP